MVRRMKSTNMLSIHGPAMASASIDGDQLWNEGQRGLVDLRDRLKQADHQAHHQHHTQNRRSHHEQCQQGILPHRQHHLRVHRFSLLQRQGAKLAASEPISRFQPSASTNSISLNGNATNTGDNIIMPSDINTLATTMSITRNGMKIMNPI